MVLRAQSGWFWVETEVGVLCCRLRGRLKKERQQADIAVIGDRVEVTQISREEGVIEAVKERVTRFSRKQPGPREAWKEDVLIANLDQVIIVFACRMPEMNPRLLDRFLVVAEHNGVQAVVVANKIDLVTAEESHNQFRPYEQLGYLVIYTSAATGVGIESLRHQLEGRLSAFSGPSGVGKSSLLNAIEPGLRLRTATVSSALQRGRHTTVVAEIYRLSTPIPTYVADTPGIRELAAWSIPDAELAWCFRDFRPFLGRCEFHDCRHEHEPRCAIREAVARGEISPERYESYLRQLTKAER